MVCTSSKTLESDDSEHTYQLVISDSTKGTETTWKAELLQVDFHQKVVQRVLLYADLRLEDPVDVPALRDDGTQRAAAGTREARRV